LVRSLYSVVDWLFTFFCEDEVVPVGIQHRKVATAVWPGNGAIRVASRNCDAFGLELCVGVHPTFPARSGYACQNCMPRATGLVRDSEPFSDARIELHLPIRILGTKAYVAAGDEIVRRRRASIQRFLGTVSELHCRLMGGHFYDFGRGGAVFSSIAEDDSCPMVTKSRKSLH